ncbi:MAG TPA: hypothetical protein VG432_07760, partial [Gemmatimonadaceae bacterium]|nr:hypothetical protein [Gemmatimonadaceae bacterium]
MVRTHWMGVVIPFVLIGCAAHYSPRGAYDANLITEDEIVASHAASAYDAIHKLRANFLSNRGKLTFYGEASPMPTVYVDEQRYGDISILTTIPAAVIATIRLYRSWDATTRYGTNNMGGVIAITTRRGGDETAAWRDRH